MGCACSQSPCPQSDTLVHDVRAPPRRIGSRADEWEAPSPIGDELPPRLSQQSPRAVPPSPNLDCAQLIAWKSHDEQYFVSQSLSQSTSRRLAAAAPGTALLSEGPDAAASPATPATLGPAVQRLHRVREGVAASPARLQSLPTRNLAACAAAPTPVAIAIDDDGSGVSARLSGSLGESRAGSSGNSLGHGVSGSSYEFGRGVSTSSVVVPRMTLSPPPPGSTGEDQPAADGAGAGSKSGADTAGSGGAEAGAEAGASGRPPRAVKKPHRWITATMWEVPAEAIKATARLAKPSRGVAPLSGTVAGAAVPSQSSGVIERFELAQALHAVRFRRTAPPENVRRELNDDTSSVVATPMSAATPAGARREAPDVWLAMGISEDAFTAGGAGSDAPSGVLYARGLSRMGSYSDSFYGLPLTSHRNTDTSPETPHTQTHHLGPRASPDAGGAGFGRSVSSGAGQSGLPDWHGVGAGYGPARGPSLFLGARGEAAGFHAGGVDDIVALAPVTEDSPDAHAYQVFSMMPPRITRSQSSNDVLREAGISLGAGRAPRHVAALRTKNLSSSDAAAAPLPSPEPQYAHSSATLDWVINNGVSQDVDNGGVDPSQHAPGSVPITHAARGGGAALPPPAARATAAPVPLPSHGPLSPASCGTTSSTVTTRVIASDAAMATAMTRASSTMTTAEVSAPSPAMDWGTSPSDQYGSPSPARVGRGEFFGFSARSQSGQLGGRGADDAGKGAGKAEATAHTAHTFDAAGLEVATAPRRSGTGSPGGHDADTAQHQAAGVDTDADCAKHSPGARVRPTGSQPSGAAASPFVWHRDGLVASPPHTPMGSPPSSPVRAPAPPLQVSSERSPPRAS